VKAEQGVVLDDVGAQARARRKELGMSQEDVAYRMRVEQTVVSKIERGEKLPSPEMARRLASALGLAETHFLVSGQ
jgi:transcriptional regulator with XRE-family HTH domain